MKHWQTILIASTAAIVFPATASADKLPDKVTYQDHVRPILREKCFSCHNTNKKTADLDLSNYTSLMQGGGAGAAIEPGDAESSYLYLLVSHESAPFMPPESDRLPQIELDVIRGWIDGGALETSSSKAMIKKKKVDFSLKTAPTGKPEGPPPMPDVLNLEPVVTTQATTAVTAVATSPWAPLTAVAGQKQVVLYHSQTLQPLGVLPFPEGVPQVLKFSRSGTLLLAGGGRGASRGLAVVWDVRTGERIMEIGDELDTVLAADISADQSMVALGGPSRIVRVYTTFDGELAYEIRKHTEWIYSIEFSPDGVLLATSDRSGGMFVWEAYSGREYLTLKGHSGAITAVSWRSDSNVLASCSRDSTIRLWEMNNGGQIRNWGAHGNGVECVEFCRDGRLVSCGRDNVAKLWQQDGNQIRAFPAFGDLALRVSHCDEADRVIAGDWNGTIKVWNAADGTDLGILNQNPPRLEARLAAAQRDLAVQQQQQAALLATYNAEKATLDRINTDLNTARAQFAEAQRKSEETTSKANALRETITKRDGAIAEAAKQEIALKAVVPKLREAATGVQEAFSTLKNDGELEALSAKVRKQFETKSGALAAVTKVLVEQRNLHETAKTELATCEKQIVDLTTAMNTAKQQVEPLTAAVPQAQKAMNNAKTASDAASQAAGVAQATVNQITDYIRFRDELVALGEKKTEFGDLEIAVAEANAELAETEAALTDAQRVVTTAKANLDTAVDAVNQVKQTIAALTSERDAAQQAVSAMEPVLPVLNDALNRANEAVAKSGNDEEIAAAAAQVKTVLDRKTAAINEQKKTVTERNTALPVKVEELKTAEAQQTEMSATLAVTTKAAADKAAAVPPVEQKISEARQKLATASQTLEAAMQAVEARRVKLRRSLYPESATVQKG